MSHPSYPEEIGFTLESIEDDVPRLMLENRQLRRKVDQQQQTINRLEETIRLLQDMVARLETELRTLRPPSAAPTDAMDQ